MNIYSDREKVLEEYKANAVDETNTDASLPERIDFDARGYITIHYKSLENKDGEARVKNKRLSLYYDELNSRVAPWNNAVGEKAQADAAKATLYLTPEQMNRVINIICVYQKDKYLNSRDTFIRSITGEIISCSNGLLKEFAFAIGEDFLLRGSDGYDMIRRMINNARYKKVQEEYTAIHAQQANRFVALQNQLEELNPKVQFNKLAMPKSSYNEVLKNLSEEYTSFGFGEEIITKDYVNKNLGDKRHIKISKSVKTIEDAAFLHYSKLESVDFSGCSSLERVGCSAFTSGGFLALKDVNFSGCSSLKEIGLAAFSGCNNIQSIDFSGCSSLKRIGNSAFKDCRRLKRLNFSGCTNLESIGQFSFEDCRALEALNFSGFSYLKTISNFAFRDCSALKSVNFSECSSLQTIGKYAFDNCEDLTSVDFSGCSALSLAGDAAFKNCGYVKSLDFSGCSISKDFIKSFCLQNVEKLYLGKDIYFLRLLLDFHDMRKLVEFGGENVTTVESCAFEGLSNLKIVKLPNLKQCPASAFAGCNNLDLDKSVLPDSVREELRVAQETKKKNIESAENIAAKYLTHEFGIKNLQELRDVIIKSQKKNAEYRQTSVSQFVNVGYAKYLINQKFEDYIKYNFGIKDRINDMDLMEFERESPGRSGVATDLRYGVETDVEEFNVKKSIAIAEKMMSKYKILNESVLYRGVKGYETVDYMVLDGQRLGVFKDNPESLIGKIICDDAYISTSMDKKIAEDYCNYLRTNQGKLCYYNGEKVMLELLVPKGNKMAPLKNYYSEILANRKQKYMVVDVGYCDARDVFMSRCGSAGIKTPVIRKITAFALPSDIVGAKRCKKDENGGMIFSDYTSEELYTDPDFAKLQEEYEINLGKYAYRHPLARQAVQTALEKAALAYKNRFLIGYSGLARLYRKKFLTEKPKSSGVVGTKIRDDDLFAMLGVDMPEDVQEKINRRALQPGNLREKMMAFEIASEENNQPPWLTDTMRKFFTQAPHIYRKDRPKNDRLRYVRDFNYQDNMGGGLERSQRERTYQEQYKLYDDKSPITYGQMLYEPCIQNGKERANFMGKRLISGTSGHAMRLIHSCKELGMSKTDIINFRLALIGCLIPEKNHSLYEILQGAQEVGLAGGENLTTAETMDKYIAPLQEEELRREACKYTLKGYKKYVGLFPIEAIAEKKAEK